MIPRSRGEGSFGLEFQGRCSAFTSCVTNFWKMAGFAFFRPRVISRAKIPRRGSLLPY
jgi:hypothetical protein